MGGEETHLNTKPAYGLNKKANEPKTRGEHIQRNRSRIGSLSPREWGSRGDEGGPGIKEQRLEGGKRPQSSVSGGRKKSAMRASGEVKEVTKNKLISGGKMKGSRGIGGKKHNATPRD